MSSAASTVPAPASGHCRTAHCDGEGVPCAYVDRRGLRCPTFWCADHAVAIAGFSYCRRHAGALVALGSRSRALADRPLVDNRAASLTAWVADHLDEHILSLLACLQSEGEVLVADASISARDDGGRPLCWVRGWSLVAPTGVMTRVVVEISEEDDAMVRVVVGRNTVFTGVPPWIAWHRMGLHVPEPVDAAGRKAFYTKVKSAIIDELVRVRLGRGVPPTVRATDPDGEPDA